MVDSNSTDLRDFLKLILKLLSAVVSGYMIRTAFSRFFHSIFPSFIYEIGSGAYWSGAVLFLLSYKRTVLCHFCKKVRQGISDLLSWTHWNLQIINRTSISLNDSSEWRSKFSNWVHSLGVIMIASENFFVFPVIATLWLHSAIELWQNEIYLRILLLNAHNEVVYKSVFKSLHKFLFILGHGFARSRSGLGLSCTDFGLCSHVCMENLLCGKENKLVASVCKIIHNVHLRLWFLKVVVTDDIVYVIGNVRNTSINNFCESGRCSKIV